ncbi:MAG: hypothetical protein ACFB6R_16390 [Alphaproteobacteria bacterium]
MQEETRAAVLLIIGAFVGLFLPDIDQYLRFLLHHRSIVTHSVLVPLLLLTLRREPLIRQLTAGLSCGIGIHLAVDALSPMVGFGRVYLPFPFFTSLGAFGSLVWLVGNAGAALFMSLKYSALRTDVFVKIAGGLAAVYFILEMISFALSLFALLVVLVGLYLFVRAGRRSRRA